MTNFESGEKLLKEAEEYFEEMVSAYKRGSWNIVIRRAQEVVELSLKGVLKIMGVEYPKVHDPARFFIETLDLRGIEVDEATRLKIEETSADLADKRAPAFYFEKEYNEAEASKAKQGVEFIVGFVKTIKKRLN